MQIKNERGGIGKREEKLACRGFVARSIHRMLQNLGKEREKIIIIGSFVAITSHSEVFSFPILIFFVLPLPTPGSPPNGISISQNQHTIKNNNLLYLLLSTRFVLL